MAKIMRRGCGQSAGVDNFATDAILCIDRDHPRTSPLRASRFGRASALRGSEGSPRERRSVIGRSRGKEVFEVDLDGLPEERLKGCGNRVIWGMPDCGDVRR